MHHRTKEDIVVRPHGLLEPRGDPGLALQEVGKDVAVEDQPGHRLVLVESPEPHRILLEPVPEFIPPGIPELIWFGKKLLKECQKALILGA